MEQKDMEDLLHFTAGVQQAHELMLQALIASHPNPQALHATWQQFLPESLDAVAEHLPTAKHRAFGVGMRTALATMSKTLEARFAR